MMEIYENVLSEQVIGLAIKVHRVLGPGLFESVYEKALCYELDKNKIPYKRQVKINIKYIPTVIPAIMLSSFKLPLAVKSVPKI